MANSTPNSPSSKLSNLRFAHVVGLSLLFRFALVIYAEYHDAHSVLKYTDVDYRVFSDAARFTLNPTEQNFAGGLLGKDISLGDPYTRATYRYTPLLALLLTPNEWIHSTFGKVLFSLSDIFIGILLRRILASSTKIRPLGTSKEGRAAPSKAAPGLTRDEMVLAAIWMLNPLPANISTRGSAESLLGLIVIATLYFSLQRKWVLSGILLGLSVHWKIYPIIYMASLIPFVGEENGSHQPFGFKCWIKWCTNRQRVQFAAVAAASFAFLSVSMYLIWGFPFLEHSYLYHVGRTDHRHNFSVYFYPLYLGLFRQDSHGLPTGQSRLLSLAAFLPQVLISVGGGFYLAWKLTRVQDLRKSRPRTAKEVHKSAKAKGDRTETALSTGLEHLPFLFLLQTFTFVTLNKVCTSQYFMWYLWFLPLVIPRLLPAPDSSGGIPAMKGILMVALWIAGQALWLSQGYRLEFLGEDVFLELWASGLIMLGINAWLVVSLVNGYRWI